MNTIPENDAMPQHGKQKSSAQSESSDREDAAAPETPAQPSVEESAEQSINSESETDVLKRIDFNSDGDEALTMTYSW